MRRARQHGSGWSRRLLLCALMVWLPGAGAQSTTPSPKDSKPMPQNTTPMPTGAAAVPPMPGVAPVATPTVAQSQAVATKIVDPTLPSMPAVEGTEVDRVVAIVNGEVILDSDVDRERRFAALLPYGEASGVYKRGDAIGRLINRDLILQQLEVQPGDVITYQAAAKDLKTLRASIPACARFHCETKAGWDKFLASEGFTEESLTKLWQERMEVLAFIELRFRMGTRITQGEVDEYYTETLLPQYAARHVTAPPVRTISKRIEEVLLQQRVSKLLDDWLSSLRAQGNVVVLHAESGPGEEAR